MYNKSLKLTVFGASEMTANLETANLGANLCRKGANGAQLFSDVFFSLVSADHNVFFVNGRQTHTKWKFRNFDLKSNFSS